MQCGSWVNSLHKAVVIVCDAGGRSRQDRPAGRQGRWMWSGESEDELELSGTNGTWDSLLPLLGPIQWRKTRCPSLWNYECLWPRSWRSWGRIHWALEDLKNGAASHQQGELAGDLQQNLVPCTTFQCKKKNKQKKKRGCGFAPTFQTSCSHPSSEKGFPENMVSA